MLGRGGSVVAIAGAVAVVAIAAVAAARPATDARARLSNPAARTARKAGSHTPAFVLAWAARTAAGNCDAGPTDARYVRTTRQAAESLSGDRVDSDQPLYLVFLRGDFVDYYAHGIYRARDDFPRGSVITFTIDQHYGILDFGIGNGEPNLARLGAVHDFLAELRAAPEAASPPVCAHG